MSCAAVQARSTTDRGRPAPRSPVATEHLRYAASNNQRRVESTLQKQSATTLHITVYLTLLRISWHDAADGEVFEAHHFYLHVNSVKVFPAVAVM